MGDECQLNLAVTGKWKQAAQARSLICFKKVFTSAMHFLFFFVLFLMGSITANTFQTAEGRRY